MLLQNIFNIGACEEWGIGRIASSSYLGVDNRKYQDCLINTTCLKCITCYTMEDYAGDDYLNHMNQ